MSAELAIVPVAEMVMSDDGEAVDLTPDEAEVITSRIRRWANSFPVEDVVRAFRGRIWVALAYDSWAEWCECELGGLKLPVPQRREVVSELAGAGMSNRAIADTIGVSRETVNRDRATDTNVSVGEDRKTLGQDGRERAYPPPKPPAPQPDPEIVDAEIVDPPTPSAPRRRSLTDTARELGLESDKLAGRLERFAADDRLGRNKSEVAPHLRHYLARMIKVCQDLNDQLNT